MQNTPAVANETVAYSETADLAFAFEDVENLQAVAMTDKQMAETQGAALPLAFVALATGGGAVGAWSNHYNSYKNTGQFASTSSTLRATGKGALTGASLYGGARGVSIARNLKIDGPSKGLKHGNGRVVGVRHNTKPVFRVDYHPNPSPKKLHIHIAPNMKAHRPWNAPWKKY